LLLGLALGFVTGAMAQSQPFSSHVNQVTEAPGGEFADSALLLRFWSPEALCETGSCAENGNVNPSGGNDCVGFKLLWDPPYCQVQYRPAGELYKGYTENVFNWNKTFSEFHASWDLQQNGGTADHIGYYAWSCKTVVDGASSSHTTLDCSGSDLQDCLGAYNQDDASSISNVPARSDLNPGDNTLDAWYSLTPIPVPKVQGVTDSLVDLSWDVASGQNCGATGFYDLYYYIDPTGECTEPSDADYVAFTNTAFQKIDGTTTTVDVSNDLNDGDNFDPATSDNCIFFATKLYFGDTGEGTPVRSVYVSANSQGVTFNELSADVTDLSAEWVGGNRVSVSWATSLEENVKGFYVTRAFTTNGDFQRVSKLIPAKGEPSSYAFVDEIDIRQRQVRASGLYYKLEVIDDSDNVTVEGPVSVERPDGPTRIRPNQGGDVQRRLPNRGVR
jgi:hypothetical protein